MYVFLKHFHITCAALSISGFALRGLWMAVDSPRRQHRLTEILPHVIDTFFLASGISLALIIHQYPFAAPWLTAKVIGLLAYIAFGSVALKYGRTRSARLAAFGLALLTFAWLLSVALLHNPAGFFSSLAASA